MSEHHNSLAADNLPAVTPAAAFMKCCGCSRSHSNDGHVSRAITTSSTVSFQAHLKKRRNCAVALPGCRHAAAGPTRRHLRVPAGCLKARRINARTTGGAYTKLQTGDRWQTATHTPNTKHILRLPELSRNVDIPPKIITRSANLSRTNAGI